MILTINGKEHTVSASTLTTLLNTLGYDAELVATAVNGQFISREHRTTLKLSEGDAVEILAPMQGG
ncbi:sulfur carrier protein ThiS [Entomobacter blattae]|uniref:ThiS family protein n=1 Tax=Entomobacter blattae TaxID=2762277 RepID=A0A7H1NRF8_9PROT|nr:sulfur carrier protein ThiS [Entomobacter blattae]QNT78368.1 ThiS family protein [Entomobacter blattae]